MSVNKVMILGRLGADPKEGASPENPVCFFNVATSDSFTTKDGEKKEEVEWHRVVVWGKQAEICLKYIRKGWTVFIEGKNKTRSWEDEKSGEKKFMTEVIAHRVDFSMNPKPQTEASY